MKLICIKSFDGWTGDMFTMDKIYEAEENNEHTELWITCNDSRPRRIHRTNPNVEPWSKHKWFKEHMVEAEQ